MGARGKSGGGDGKGKQSFHLWFFFYYPNILIFVGVNATFMKKIFLIPFLAMALNAQAQVVVSVHETAKDQPVIPAFVLMISLLAASIIGVLLRK